LTRAAICIHCMGPVCTRGDQITLGLITIFVKKTNGPGIRRGDVTLDGLTPSPVVSPMKLGVWRHSQTKLYNMYWNTIRKAKKCDSLTHPITRQPLALLSSDDATSGPQIDVYLAVAILSPSLGRAQHSST
jgi:hypothetical protein